MDRQVVQVLRDMPEHDRFLRGMVSWVGFNQTPLRYDRQARVAGQTKYPLTKMIRFALDGITSFSRVPLRVAGFLGFAACSVALVGIAYSLLIRLFTDRWVPGWTTLMLVILFMGGAQLICLGIIGEYVGRTFMEGKRRPLYVIREKRGFEGGKERNLKFDITTDPT
jgi:dolichol-phosphate mannosyltransferase